MIVQIGDMIFTKKQHPCGNSVWEVVRVGADFKLKCTKCQHVVLVDSQSLKKMIKHKLPKKGATS